MCRHHPVYVLRFSDDGLCVYIQSVLPLLVLTSRILTNYSIFVWTPIVKLISFGTDGRNCRQCDKVLRELENIDDETDNFGELNTIVVISHGKQTKICIAAFRCPLCQN